MDNIIASPPPPLAKENLDFDDDGVDEGAGVAGLEMGVCIGAGVAGAGSAEDCSTPNKEFANEIGKT